MLMDDPFVGMRATFASPCVQRGVFVSRYNTAAVTAPRGRPFPHGVFVHLLSTIRLSLKEHSLLVCIIPFGSVLL